MRKGHAKLIRAAIKHARSRRNLLSLHQGYEYSLYERAYFREQVAMVRDGRIRPPRESRHSILPNDRISDVSETGEQ